MLRLRRSILLRSLAGSHQTARFSSDPRSEKEPDRMGNRRLAKSHLTLASISTVEGVDSLSVDLVESACIGVSISRFSCGGCRHRRFYQLRGVATVFCQFGFQPASKPPTNEKEGLDRTTRPFLSTLLLLFSALEPAAFTCLFPLPVGRWIFCAL